MEEPFISWYRLNIQGHQEPISLTSLSQGIFWDDNLSFNAFRIYPNPVKDVLHLDLTSFNGNFNQIQIVNMLGKQVLNVFQVSGGQVYTIAVDKLTDGLYFLMMRTSTGLYSRKFVIHR